MVLAFLPLSGPPAGAQVLNIHTYRNEHGLPQQQIRAIHQDSHGYLWVGSYGGLSRYDGLNFRTYATAEGLSTSPVAAIAEDAAGRLAIGTEGGGLCLFDRETFECYGVGEGMPDEDVFDLLADPRGGVWAGTTNGLAYVEEGVVEVFKEAQGLPSSNILSLARDEEGDLWVGTYLGLARLVGGRFEIEIFEGLSPGPVSVLESTPWGLLVGQSGALFLRTEAGITRLELPPDLSRAIFVEAAVDSEGQVWIATAQDGALRYDGSRVEHLTRANGLPTEELYAALVDRDGTIWFGSVDGLVTLVPGPFESYFESDGLPSAFVRAITGDLEGQMWVGTREGVASWEEGHFQARISAADLPDPRVYALAPTPDGGWLVGTTEGLTYWRGRVLATYGVEDGLPDPRVRSLLPDPNGGIWIGTRAGIARWEEGRIVAFPDDPILGDAYALDMVYDRQGRLWIPLRTGQVVLIDSAGSRYVGPPEGVTQELIWSIDIDQAGRVWLATNGDGVYYIEEDGSNLVHLTTQDGLVNDFVWSVLCDSGGSVWMFTNRGLDRLSGGEFRHYRRSDGMGDMEGNATAAWEAPDGALWFGAGSAFVRYHPEREFENPHVPPVFVESMSTPAGPVDRGGQIPNNFNGLTVEFSALSYRSEGEVRFSYRLLGLSEEWSLPTATRSVHYAGLGRGRYEFQLLGSNEAGVWNPEPASFPFEVRRAFWQAWWFRLIALLGVLGIARGVLLLRTRAEEAERRRLESLVSERTKALVEKTTDLEAEIQERQRLEDELLQSRKLEAVGRLAAGIAHDFNNIMTAILANANLLSDELEAGHQLRGEVEAIETAAQRAASLTGQLLAFGRKSMIRAEPLSLNDVVRASEDMVRRSLGEDVELTIELAPDLWTVRADRRQMRDLIAHLAENAREAMPDGGRATISTENAIRPGNTEADADAPSGPCALLRFSDTGRGMDVSTLSHLFEPFYTTKGVGEGSGLGLATVYGIVKQSGGEIHVDSAPEGGTTFEICFPREEPEESGPAGDSSGSEGEE